MEHARLALAGDLEGLRVSLNQITTDDKDRIIYKWLCVASDFGHEEAEELIADLLEHTSLRYDDSGCEQASVKWELAVAYLEGSEGLPIDLDKAGRYLEEIFLGHTLESISQATLRSHDAGPVLSRLSVDSKKILEHWLAGGDVEARVRHRIARVARLLDCNAPNSIVEHEKDLLRVESQDLQREALLSEALGAEVAAILDRS